MRLAAPRGSREIRAPLVCTLARRGAADSTWTVLCVLTHQGTFRPAPSSSDGLTPAPVVAVADIISFRDGRKLVLLRGLSRDVQPCRNDLFPQVLYCCIEQALQALLGSTAISFLTRSISALACHSGRTVASN